MRQEIEGRELDSAEARGAQLPWRTGTELEDLVKQRRRPSVRGTAAVTRSTCSISGSPKRVRCPAWLSCASADALAGTKVRSASRFSLDDGALRRHRPAGASGEFPPIAGSSSPGGTAVPSSIAADSLAFSCRRPGVRTPEPAAEEIRSRTRPGTVSEPRSHSTTSISPRTASPPLSAETARHAGDRFRPVSLPRARDRVGDQRIATVGGPRTIGFAEERSPTEPGLASPQCSIHEPAGLPRRPYRARDAAASGAEGQRAQR